METLKSKIALVTGVGRKQGIGAAICRELAKNGADIFFTYWHAYDEKTHTDTKGEKPEEFADELKRYGVRVAITEIDLSQVDQEEMLGKEKYNDLKEALTILLNVECRDLLPEGVSDAGYPQHKERRERILELWTQEPDIRKLWQALIEKERSV